MALQVAENKRMQALLAKAIEDLGRMTRLAENLNTRVNILEAHTGSFPAPHHPPKQKPSALTSYTTPLHPLTPNRHPLVSGRIYGRH